jgi:hypothetical protein
MPLFLDIDPHGRVVPLSDEVRRALADRAGRFLLLPAAADLLVARRTPAAGGTAAQPRCILAGDLNGFPIADFVAFVHQSRLSGVLTVSGGGAERSISFKDGEVRRASSSVPGERLGEVAIRLGFANEQQVAAAAQPGKPLGRALVDAGVMGPNDLWKCFHEQVSAVFHSVLLSREGTFQLMDEDVTDRPGTPLTVNTQSLLMDGIRRIDEMSLFLARIPGPRAYVHPREPRRPITLKPPENAVLALVDGASTVAEIATRARLSEFEATKILYHLAEAGYVEAVAHPFLLGGRVKLGPPGPRLAVVDADPASRLRTIAAGMNELLRLVMATVPEAGRPAFRAAVRAFLTDVSQPLAPVWARAALAEDGALDEEALLGNVAAMKSGALSRLEPSGDPARLLLAGLRELLFFQLFAAGERLPREADDALGVAIRPKLAEVEKIARPHGDGDAPR